MQRDIIIKNMVCPRCLTSVKEIFEEVGLSIVDISLGKVSVNNDITTDQKKALKEKLVKKGFELLDDKHTQLINEIKSLIIHEIHYQEEHIPINLSTHLAQKLPYDYTYLSRLFSSVEGRTIEKFVMAQKIEKVKELLTYKELTLSEIAFKMHYSSTAHLSTSNLDFCR